MHEVIDQFNRDYRLHRVLRWMIHGGAIGCLWFYGISSVGISILAISYGVSMLALTVGYHRYFSHRGFWVGRWTQFALGCFGCLCLQGGPLAWAQIHRRHHQIGDRREDYHSPIHGFYEAHMGWLSNPDVYKEAFKVPRDFVEYPELRWLDRYHIVPVVLFMASLALCGGLVEWQYPSGPVTPGFMVAWGGVVRTVFVWHLAWSINSAGHIFGNQPFQTNDLSRNCWWLALLTAGEGWHNNHHRYPISARHGLRWWQVDVSYGVIRCLVWLGLAWDVRMPSDQDRIAN